MNNDFKPSSYYFSFYDNHFDRIFYGRLLSGRCLANTVKGVRCKRRCVIGFEYSRDHLVTEKWLQIRRSTIEGAGLGLFAHEENAPPNTIVFEKGDTICQYNGEHLSRDEIIGRYANFTAPYGLGLSANEFIDGAIERGIGSLANNNSLEE